MGRWASEEREFLKAHLKYSEATPCVCWFLSEARKSIKRICVTDSWRNRAWVLKKSLRLAAEI